jgi:hydrophobic/amphiphilic exporter-1 (mainly G- bacteria), HAE1 family
VTKVFLTRPVLAIVCSLMILIGGLVVIPTLPVGQYPQIAPPVVTITATYTGASPQAVEAQVTTPLEEAVNTAEGLRYISSQSEQGTSTITLTFTLETNLDIAAADVQNLVQSALGQLPATVQQLGIQVSKNSGAFVMAFALSSSSSRYDTLYLSNYAQLNIVNDLSRVAGVSQVRIFGQRQYAMRIWLNPHLLAAQGLDAGDVVTALQEQNVEIATGSIGSAPVSASQRYTYTVNALTQLSSPQEFANIILRTDPSGGFTRLGDVARVELGAQDYTTDLRFNGNSNAVGLGILQYPTANAMQVASAARAKMAELAKHFPAGIHYDTAFDTSDFVVESIREVILTLLISILLVVLVIFMFLQNARATMIPAVTIPVSLIGTFFVMKTFGFTINTITLFGITLATGLVVDDAIVVIENVARHMALNKSKRSGIESTAEAMREIQSAVVASSLVLLAVFIPVGFFPGTTGQLYKQFALTIAAAIAISLFQALTLAPALSARLLSGESTAEFALFRAFNAGYARFRTWYASELPGLLRGRLVVAGLFAAALLVTLFMFTRTPTSFIPSEDQGYFIVLLQAPEGTALPREQQIAREAEAVVRSQPQVHEVFDVGGFSFSGSAPNRGIMFVQLNPWNQRRGPNDGIDAVIQRVNYGFFTKVPEAQVFAVNPPAINGVSSFGGFQFELEDRTNLGLPVLMKTAYAMMGMAAKDPRLQNVFTQFRINSPQVQMKIDRDKVKAIGISLADVFDTLQVNLASLYVNNFTYLNRSWQVDVQADQQFRNSISSLQGIYVSSGSAANAAIPTGTNPFPTPPPAWGTTSTNANYTVMTPIGALVTLNHVLAAPIITHYNLYRNIELNGTNAPGHGSGEAIAAMDQIAQRVMPPGMTYEWSGLQLDEIAAGSLSTLFFALGIVFVFMVLAAQYESFVDPLIVLLAVPAALFGALGFMDLRHLPIPFLSDVNLTQDAYAQVGYVMLIGLASKNAILIVEFANQQLRAGATAAQAAMRAAQTRLRPILMTSIAFVIGVTPLVFATGAGSSARHSLGTVVFGGMLVSTFLNLAITPVLYVIVKSLELRGRARSAVRLDGRAASPPAPIIT